MTAIRVLYLATGTHRHGGAERVLTSLLDELEPGRVDPLVVVFGEGDLAEHLRHRQIDTVVVPVNDAFRHAARYRGPHVLVASAIRAGPRFTAAVGRVRAEARRFRADVVHSNGTRAHVMTPFLRDRHRRSTVATLHDLPQSGFERRVMGTALRRADVVIANSALVARTYQPLGVRCQTIDNPIAVPEPRDRRQARERLGVPPDAFVVANVAHFQRYKGQLDLIQAVGRLGPDSHLLVAGGPLYGPASEAYEQELRVAAAASGAASRIHFVGLLDDVSWVFAASDTVAQCSTRTESFGMVLVEALLTGTPVISSTSGYPGEMLQDGETGLLYPPGDLAALTACLRRMHDDVEMRTRLGVDGQAWAIHRFRAGRYGAEVTKIYETLADQRQSLPAVPAH